MHRFKKVFALLSLCLLLVLVTYQLSNAQPIDVNVGSSYYHIDGNYRDLHNGLFDSYDQSAEVPISDSLRIEYGGGNYMYAESEAFDCGVSAHTASWINNNSKALAEAEWTFRPTNDFDQFTIDVIAGGVFLEFGIYLKDLTVDQVISNDLFIYLYTYGDYKYYSGHVERDPTEVLLQGSIGELDLDYGFTSDHLYKLYLYVQCDANDDMQDVGLSVRDMKVVPEPSTIILLGAGLLGLAGLRRKSRKS